MLNEPRRVAVYVRRSPNIDLVRLGQELKKYTLEKGWEIAGEYEDEVLNKAASPKGMAVLLSEAGEKKIDTILIRRLDDLGESVEEVKMNLRAIKKQGIDLVSLEDGVSTIDQGGLVFLLFETLSAIKALESRERQKGIRAGIEKARDKGKKLGRPEVPDRIMARAKELYDQGFTCREIGRLLDIDESTVRKRIKNNLNSKRLNNEESF